MKKFLSTLGTEFSQNLWLYTVLWEGTSKCFEQVTAKYIKFIRLLSFNLTYNKDTQTACYVTKVLVLKHPTYYSKCFNSPQISWISTQPHMQRQ